MKSMIISAKILKLVPKQVCSQKLYIYSTSSEITLLLKSEKVLGKCQKVQSLSLFHPYLFIIKLNTEIARSTYLCICGLPDQYNDLSISRCV